ncbi:MAG: DNA-directed RNA polymerase subunit beta' [Lachnospiraceae bacterium]|nr:DNA-directed RNA polymerase subunit beta' [Lachnospiraceae bacterium]
MSENKNDATYQPMTFDAIKIGLASPEKIREWSRRGDDPDFGIVTKPETINYRTLKPEKDGLFCEKIFGPSKDWECHCGKYKRIRYKGVVCDRCGVEVTKANVRRERMGRIELAAPVSHIWYFKGIPSRMGLILDISPRVLEKVLYFASYIVLPNKEVEADCNWDLGDPVSSECSLQIGQVLSETEYQKAREEFGNKFRAGMGAESIKILLHCLGENLDSKAEELKEELKNATGQKRARIVKRLEVVEAFRESGNKPEWMILDVIPVIPPDLRPMVQLDGGRFATSDLNDLYRRIINRNNRLERLLELGAPDIIVRNEKRMLQEAVDALIDNGRRGRPVTGPGNRALKSLSDMLKGKGGRFRQNLLGKRVDYSGRSVIVVGPELKIYQCGLPKEMAIELFKPFVMKELVGRGISQNIKNAKKLVERLDAQVWDVLEDVIAEHPVMLNRAPTLHRLGIQAFEPKLVEGKAIKLHPLVCTAFNADFDGDQMAVHLPLSVEAQAECRFLLLSPNNLLKPSDGGPVAVPSQDMVLGIYYLTMHKFVDHKEAEFVDNIAAEYDSIDALKKAFEDYQAKVSKAVAGKSGAEAQKAVDAIKGVKLDRNTIVKVCVDPERGRMAVCRVVDIIGRYYNSMDDALLAYENKEITLHQTIYVKRTVTWQGEEITGIIETTLGRLIFNEMLPQDLEYVDRSKRENALILEVDFHVGRKQLKQILERVINIHGASVTAEVLDLVKATGYHYSTQAAMTVSISDMTVPASKPVLLEKAQETIEKISRNYRRGLITEEERYRAVVETWNQTDKQLTSDLLNGLDKYNNIFMMADSGARGSNQQIKQLAGMRGLMADTTGRTIELPIKSNFREGLDVLEYFMSAHGARKGLSDTAIRTADSGYLTRRMVDVSQELIIREIDCCEGKENIPGMEVYAFMDGKETIEGLKDRIQGRFACDDIVDKDGNVLVKKNHMITPSRASKVMKFGIDTEGNRITDDEGNVNVASRIKVRNILCCRSHNGICAKCYGANMASGEAVQVGEAVGIIAAQSIGEPGTQLTMRTFHTGGVAGDDITQGLPRVEELFEARKPKGLAIITEFGGVATISDTKKKREVIVTNKETGESKAYLIPYGSRIKVTDGQPLAQGDPLTEGSYNPHDLLKIKGIHAVQDYLIREVQRVYRLQGVDINDKHIEVIVRQMLKKIRVENNGDAEFLPGTLVDVLEFEDMNEQLIAEGKQPAEGSQIIMGITKAALATNSFLSAASFQETTKVLTEAAIKGKIDPLIGLKENVILGKLIPAGTGMKRYRDVELSSDSRYEALISAANTEVEVDETVAETAEVAEEVEVEVSEEE